MSQPSTWHVSRRVTGNIECDDMATLGSEDRIFISALPVQRFQAGGQHAHTQPNV